MADITRKEFLALTGHTPERFDAKARRNQFPFLHVEMLDRSRGKNIGEDSRYRSYRAIDALATILSDQLFSLHGMPLTESCGLVVNLYDPLRCAWPAICASSQIYLRLMKSETIAAETDLAQVLCGGYRYSPGNFLDTDTPGSTSLPLLPLNWSPLVGTFAQIAERHSDPLLTAQSIVLTSVTLAAARMRQRALIHGINLVDELAGDFWDPDRYQPEGDSE